MPIQTFSGINVYDAQGNPAPGAVGNVYALSDTTYSTPLATTDLYGLPTTVTANSRGKLPTFRVDHAQPVVMFKSGEFVEPLISIEGLLARFAEIEALVESGAGGGGVDDEGIGALISESSSATALALAQKYGVGILYLEVEEEVPVGTPAGTLIVRTGAGSGGGPGTPVVYVSDLFERTEAAGWGTADVGGPWSVSSTVKSSVSGGAARASTTASDSVGGTIQGFSQADTETHLVTSFGNTSGARLVHVHARRQSGSLYQQVTLRQYGGAHATSPGRVDISFDNGATYAVTGALTGVAADQKFHVKVRVTGASPTLAQVKVWLDGTTEPTAWTGTTTWASGPQVAGYGAVLFYSTGSEPGTAQHALHEFTITGV